MKINQLFWTNGYLFRKITGQKSFLQCVPNGWQASLEIREYPFNGIEDCFDPENGWKPCTQDQFVQAYCEAINNISEASGILHLPLQMDLIDNTSNPES